MKTRKPKRPPTKLASMRSRINDLEVQVTELQAQLVRERWPMRDPSELIIYKRHCVG